MHGSVDALVQAVTSSRHHEMEEGVAVGSKILQLNYDIKLNHATPMEIANTKAVVNEVGRIVTEVAQPVIQMPANSKPNYSDSESANLTKVRQQVEIAHAQPTMTVPEATVPTVSVATQVETTPENAVATLEARDAVDLAFADIGYVATTMDQVDFNDSKTL